MAPPLKPVAPDDLLAAKRDLRPEKELAALDAFDAVILDDIGYVQQNRDEMEVLFTFLSERYERKSVIITSNQRENSESHEGFDLAHHAGRFR